jgi:hypothetical protein
MDAWCMNAFDAQFPRSFFLNHFIQQRADDALVRQPVDGTGTFSLVNSGSSQALANNVDLSTGRTVVTVPRVNGGNGYTIVRE